jgi:selenophosphate synthetase-related protein
MKRTAIAGLAIASVFAANVALAGEPIVADVGSIEALAFNDDNTCDAVVSGVTANAQTFSVPVSSTHLICDVLEQKVIAGVTPFGALFELDFSALPNNVDIALVRVNQGF